MNRFFYPDRDLPARLLGHAQRIRSFANDVLLPHARAVDEERRFRRETVADLARAGILGGTVGAQWGGSAWTPLELVVAHEEIGAVCANTRGFLAVQGGLVTACLEEFGTEEQKQAWLPSLVSGAAIGCFALTEPEAGSDVAAIQSRADRRGEEFVLRGQKIWITNGGIADLAVVFCTVDPDQGRQGITAFLVETGTAGLRREPMPGIELGHRGSDHAQLHLDEIRVCTANLLGAVGQGFEVAMAGLARGRLSVAAGGVGIHRAALETAVDFVARRQQFGKPLSAFQMVQERIADTALELLAARALVYRCARRRSRGAELPGDLAAAKLYATEAAARAADQAVMLLGGRGYSSAFPAERLLRDAMGLRIYEGTSVIQKTILARSVFGSG